MKHGLIRITNQVKSFSASWTWVLLIAFFLSIFLAITLSPQISAGDGDNLINDLPPIPEPVKKHPKLDSSLADKAEKAAKPQAPSGPSKFIPQTIEPPIEKARVIVETEPGQKGIATEAIHAAGGQVETTYENLVQAQVPVSALTTLADNPNVRFIQRPIKPVPAIITTQGLSVIGATTWQGSGINGKGVKIAILDDGFQGYTSLLGTELPSYVNIKSFRYDQDIQAGSQHGTAVAEIIYDIAPGAQLYLVNFGTKVELGNAVDWLIAQGVHIISHSIVWPGSGPGDGTGLVNDMVVKATNAGILWVNGSGNSATRHWSGTWVDNDSDNWLNFLGSDETQNITVSAGQEIRVYLKWDDTWGASGNDYGLYLYNSSMILVEASLNSQNGNDDPIEYLEYVAPSAGTYHISIRKSFNSKVSKFNLISGQHDLQYPTPAGSLAIPADSPYALAVGAVSWSSPGTLENYSSQGPTVDGRVKPDLAAPTCVNTAAIGGFCGTSSATPHVSGAAALVKQANPTWAPAQVKAFLESRAVDLGVAGKDNLFGSGRLNLGAVPTLWISTMSWNTPMNNNTPTFSWLAATGAAYYEVRTDNGAWVNVGNVLTYTKPTSLADGIHTFEARASDNTGTKGTPNSITFMVDTTPPTSPANVLKTGMATFTWTASTDAGSGIDHYEVRMDSGAWAAIGNVTTYTWPNALPYGSYVFGVRAIDKAGNVGIAASLAFGIAELPNLFYGSASIDGVNAAAGIKVSALIDDKEVASATYDGAFYGLMVAAPVGQSYKDKTITFKVGSAIAIQTAKHIPGDISNLNLTVDTIPPTTPTSLTKTTPDSSNKPTFTWAAAIDSGSGVAAYGIWYGPADITAPSTPANINLTTSGNDNTPTFSWFPVTDDISGLDHYLVRVDSAAFVNAGAATTFTWNPALADGNHTFDVKAEDKAGNTSAAGSTSFLIDTIPPSPPVNLVKTTPYNISTPRFSWFAATDEGSGLDYYLAKMDFGNFFIIGNVTEFTYPILAPGVHTFEVKAVDKAGNISPPASVSFPIVAGAYPLGTVSAVPGGGGGGGASSPPILIPPEINFTATDTTFTFPNALADGKYSLKVWAVDKAGNMGPWAFLSFAIDTTPPTPLTNLVKTTPNSNNKPNFTWTAATDATSGIDHYEVQMDTGSWINIGNVTTYTWLTALSDGAHTFSLRAVDKAGNVGIAPSLSFTIVRQPIDTDIIVTHAGRKYIANAESAKPDIPMVQVGDVLTFQSAVGCFIGAAGTITEVTPSTFGATGFKPDTSNTTFYLNVTSADGKFTKGSVITAKIEGALATTSPANTTVGTGAAGDPGKGCFSFSLTVPPLNGSSNFEKTKATGDDQLVVISDGVYTIQLVIWIIPKAVFSPPIGKAGTTITVAGTGFSGSRAINIYSSPSSFVGTAQGPKVAAVPNLAGTIVVSSGVIVTDSNGSFAGTFPAMATTKYIAAMDGEGNGALDAISAADGTSSTFTIDNIPPTTPTNLAKTTPDNNNKPNFTWTTSTDATSGIDYYQAKMDAGAWSNIGNVTTYTWPTALSDGSHTLEVKAVDKAGNTGSLASATFYITLWALTLTPNSGGVGTQVFIKAEKLILAGGLIPAGGITIDGVPWNTFAMPIDSSGTLWAFLIVGGNGTTTSPGPHTVKVTDSSGATEIANFTITSVGVKLTPGYGAAGDAVQVAGSGFPAGSPVTLTWGGVAWGTAKTDSSGSFVFSAPNPTSGIPEVILPVAVSATADGVSAQSIFVDLTKFPPTIQTSTLTAPNGGETWAGGSSKSITWSAPDITDTNLETNPITLQYTTDGTTWTDIATGLANSGSYNWTVPSANSATAKVRVKAVDKAGLSATDDSNANFTIDTTPPTPLTNLVKTTPSSNNKPTFTWTASTDATSGIDYYQARMDSATFTYIGNVTSYTWPTALSNGNHIFEVKAVDKAGNIGATASSSFAVSAPAPLPMLFAGSANIFKGGVSVAAPVGSVVSAKNNGIGVGSITIVEPGKYASPPFSYLLVQGNFTQGNLIEFFVNNFKAVETASYSSGSVNQNFPISVEDSSAPVVSSLQPASGSMLMTNSVVISADYSDNLSGIDINSLVLHVDNSNVVPTSKTSSSLSYNATLTSGSHTIALSVSDKLGNIANQTWSFTIAKPLDVTWGSHTTPTSIKPGQIVGVPITLTNTGSLTWPKGGANPVYVTYHWYNASWQAVEWGIGLRSSFASDVASGQTVSITASLKAPSTPGTYNLFWDMVHEGVTWFSGQGAPLIAVSNISVAASQAKDVQWVSHSTPSTIKPGQMIGVPITLTNTGSLTWPKGGANPVYVTYHWYNTNWKPVEWGIGLRSSFSQDVPSGQMVSLTASLKAPSTAGTYNLLWDVVHEGVSWFSGAGAPLGVSSGITVAATQAKDIQWTSLIKYPDITYASLSLRPGQIVTLQAMKITNTGSQTWSKSGSNAVYVSYHWYNSSWQAVEWGIGMWTALPNDVASGQSVTINALLKAPSTPGSYNLLWDAIQPGVAWFSAGGSPLGELSVNVSTKQARDLQWVSHTTPTTIKPGQIVGVPITLTNTGSQTWPQGGANPVKISYHWLNPATGVAVVWDGLMTALPSDVVSGQMVSLTASLKAPSTPGTYNLFWDMVHEGVTWFSGQGAPLLSIEGILVQ